MGVTVKRLKPVHIETPVCCARLTDRESIRYQKYMKKNPEPDKCQFAAAYRIGRKNYCTKHAEKEALRILLNSSGKE